ncbi:hypothetical protein NPIL_373301, partial [Nephila pilipes]
SLPTPVQQILVISNGRLKKLAEMADSIMVDAGNTLSIRATDAKNQDLKINAGGHFVTSVSSGDSCTIYLQWTRETFPSPINPQKLWSS